MSARAAFWKATAELGDMTLAYEQNGASCLSYQYNTQRTCFQRVDTSDPDRSTRCAIGGGGAERLATFIGTRQFSESFYDKHGSTPAGEIQPGGHPGDRTEQVVSTAASVAAASVGELLGVLLSQPINIAAQLKGAAQCA